MHIADGVLSNSPSGMIVLGAGAAATAAGTAWALRKMDYEQVPRVALCSAAFFVVSLIHIKLGATAIHLVFSGLIGLLLGWAAFPAILIGLLLQSLFFQHGGLTTLGVNTLVMAAPAVLCYAVFHRLVQSGREMTVATAGCLAGLTAAVLAAILNAGALYLAGWEFWLLAGSALAVHLVIGLIEGLVTGSAVVFLRKVRPELLRAPLLISPVHQPEIHRA